MKFEKEYWWASSDNPHEGVVEAVEGIKDAQEFRSTDNLYHLRLYGNIAPTTLGSVSNYEGAKSSSNHRVTLNVIQSCTDTVTARIAKNKPKATFLTTGGDWSMQQKAKRLDKFVQGQFYNSNIYDVAPKVFLDACVFGTGFMKIYEMNNQIKVERTFPDEIYVDDLESRYAEPRQMFHRKTVNKDVLLHAFPEHRDAILSAERVEETSSHYRAAEQCAVYKAWHLPSAPGADDGRHVICIEGATLVDESWDKDYFPFAIIRWTERLLGFFGQGLAEQLTGVQIEINKLLKVIQDCMHLSRPKLFIEAGSQISKAHINNENWGVIEYRNQPPQFFVPKTVSGEVFSHLDRLFNRAYEIAGISTLSAQSKKPAGLESAVALREFSDIESERFMITAQAYENLFLEAAKQMIGLAKDMHERGEKVEVISHGDKDIERIKWKEINLKADQYVMKVYPTSLLPSTPAAKLQKVIEMLQAQMLTQQEARMLLDYPDLESVNQLASASYDEINMVIEDMIEKGKVHQPEPFTNLTLAIQMVQNAYTRSKVQGVPDERLDLLRRYLDGCIQMLTSMQAAAQPTTPQGGEEAEGAGGPALGSLPELTGGTPPAGMETMEEELMTEPTPTPMM